MSHFKKYLLVFLFVLGILAANSVYAEDVNDNMKAGHDNKGKWHGRMDQKINDMYKELNLSEEQKKALEANKTQNKDKMSAIFENIKVCKEEFRKEIIKSELDMAKIDSIQSRLKSAQAELVDARLSSILEVRKILNQEQFSKFISLTEGRKGNMKNIKNE